MELNITCATFERIIKCVGLKVADDLQEGVEKS